MLLELEVCALCPVESACERRQMRDHLLKRHADQPDGPEAADANAFMVKDQPYRCWLLQQCDDTPPAPA